MSRQQPLRVPGLECSARRGRIPVWAHHARRARRTATAAAGDASPPQAAEITRAPGRAALLLLSPAIYSYTTTMLRPSSLPLGVRSVEWLRAQHGNWVVDEAEHYYYGWKAPKKGGAQLKSLPRSA